MAAIAAGSGSAATPATSAVPQHIPPPPLRAVPGAPTTACSAATPATVTVVATYNIGATSPTYCTSKKYAVDFENKLAKDLGKFFHPEDAKV